MCYNKYGEERRRKFLIDSMKESNVVVEDMGEGY